jgi:hypothetical protein
MSTEDKGRKGGAEKRSRVLSPQCGFSSTVLGNNITVEAEIGKLSLVVNVAEEVWG